MKTKEIFMYILGGLATICFLTLLIFVFLVPLPETNKDIALMLLGQFAAIVTMVYSYFYGSSKSSAEKNEMIHNSTPIRNETNN